MRLQMAKAEAGSRWPLAPADSVRLANGATENSSRHPLGHVHFRLQPPWVKTGSHQQTAKCEQGEHETKVTTWSHAGFQNCHHSIQHFFLYTGGLRRPEGSSHMLRQSSHLLAARLEILLMASAGSFEFKTTWIPGDRVYFSNPSQSSRFRQLIDCHQP